MVMGRAPEPKICLRVFKIIGRALAVWPVDINSSRARVLASDILWTLVYVNYLLHLIACFLSSEEESGTITFLLASWGDVIFLLDVTFLMTVCRFQRNRMQILLRVVENFVVDAEEHEIKILKKYIWRHSSVFVIIFALSIILTLMVNSTIVKGDLLYTPLGRFYSRMTVGSVIADMLFYISQAIMMVHCSVIIVIDGIATLLMTVATVKLKILENDFRTANAYMSLRKCIQNHQHIIWYVQGVNNVIALIILKTIFTLAGYFFVGGLQILTSNDLLLCAKHTIIIISVILRIFALALCGEDITGLEANLTNTLYLSSWYMQSKNMIIAKTVIIRKCQKPLKIFISGMVPCLGMEFFFNFLYLLFSYIMTLRIVINKSYTDGPRALQ